MIPCELGDFLDNLRQQNRQADQAQKTKLLSLFEHPFFKKAPAMESLRTINTPSPEHIRACLMELARYFLTVFDEKGTK
jgi:hypothetical protein